MNHYYLMAQLPSLDGVGDGAPLPITEERFDELCTRFMGKKAVTTLHSLTLSPPREPDKTGNELLDNWCAAERQLRLALGKLRSEAIQKPFDIGEEPLSSEAIQAAQTAMEQEDPMAAEKILNHYRLGLLENLRPTDAFSEDMVFYYGLKLKLLGRIRRFDEAAGREAYRNIYHSILYGNKQEAES